jgi:hypothetical protein
LAVTPTSPPANVLLLHGDQVLAPDAPDATVAGRTIWAAPIG